MTGVAKLSLVFVSLAFFSPVKGFGRSFQGEKALLNEARQIFLSVRERVKDLPLPPADRDQLNGRFDAALALVARTTETFGGDLDTSRGYVLALFDRFRMLGLYLPFHALPDEWRGEAMQDFANGENLILTVLQIFDRELAKSANGAWKFGSETWTMLIKMDWNLANKACGALRDSKGRPCAVPVAGDLSAMLPVMKSVAFNPVFALDAVSFERVWVHAEDPASPSPLALDARSGAIAPAGAGEHLQVVCYCNERPSEIFQAGAR